MKSIFYERLFLMNRCLEQVSEILEQFRQEGIVHPLFANRRQRAVEDLRNDLSHALTGLLHEKERNECIASVRKQPEKGPAGKDQSQS